MLKKSIILIDDHKIIRDAIKDYVHDQRDYQITAEASNGLEALEILKNQSFDLIVTNINMPEMDGLSLSKIVKERNPKQNILVLTMVNESCIIREMLAIGVNGYLLKSAAKDEILSAIDSVLINETYFSGEVSHSIMSSFAGEKIRKSYSILEDLLSSREAQVLQLITAGYLNKQIANMLRITTRTVSVHKRNLLLKTGCKSLAGLVRYAYDHKVV